MNPDPEQISPDQGSPSPVDQLLTGLWQQREELGLIADELLAIFRSHGINPPRDEEHRA